jgi:hypothetical protein
MLLLNVGHVLTALSLRKSRRCWGIGKWLAVNGEAIYAAVDGLRGADERGGGLRHEAGAFTDFIASRRGDVLYAICLGWLPVRSRPGEKAGRSLRCDCSGRRSLVSDRTARHAAGDQARDRACGVKTKR